MSIQFSSSVRESAFIKGARRDYFPFSYSPRRKDGIRLEDAGNSGLSSLSLSSDGHRASVYHDCQRPTGGSFADYVGQTQSLNPNSMSWLENGISCSYILGRNAAVSEIGDNGSGLHVLVDRSS